MTSLASLPAEIKGLAVDFLLKFIDVPGFTEDFTVFMQQIHKHVDTTICKNLEQGFSEAAQMIKEKVHENEVNQQDRNVLKAENLELREQLRAAFRLLKEVVDDDPILKGMFDDLQPMKMKRAESRYSEHYLPRVDLSENKQASRKACCRRREAMPTKKCCGSQVQSQKAWQDMCDLNDEYLRRQQAEQHPDMKAYPLQNMHEAWTGRVGTDKVCQQSPPRDVYQQLCSEGDSKMAAGAGAAPPRMGKAGEWNLFDDFKPVAEMKKEAKERDDRLMEEADQSYKRYEVSNNKSGFQDTWPSVYNPYVPKEKPVDKDVLPELSAFATRLAAVGVKVEVGNEKLVKLVNAVQGNVAAETAVVEFLQQVNQDHVTEVERMIQLRT